MITRYNETIETEPYFGDKAAMEEDSAGECVSYEDHLEHTSYLESVIALQQERYSALVREVTSELMSLPTSKRRSAYRDGY